MDGGLLRGSSQRQHTVRCTEGLVLLPLCLDQPLFIDPPFLDKIMFHPPTGGGGGLTQSWERCGEEEEEMCWG